MNFSKWMFPFLCLVALPAASMAATITYEATFSGVQHEFSVSTARTAFTLSGPAPKLNATLAGGDRLKLVYRAPAGMQFNVLAKPANAVFATFYLDFWTEIALDPLIGAEPGVSFLLAGDSGPVLTPSTFVAENDAQDRFRAILALPASSRSFTRVTAVFDIPSSMNRTFTDFTLAATRLEAFAPMLTAVDPGPLLSITRSQLSDVPEPSTLALVGGALGALLLLKRRRAD